MFNEEFRSMLREAIDAGNRENNEVVPERLAVLYQIYEELAELLECEPKIVMRPAFTTGSVCAKTSVIDLGGERFKRLKKVLDKCDAMDIWPLTDGSVSFDVTVHGVFKGITNR